MQAYITWLDPVTLSEVTKPRYGSVYPWPLNTVLTYLKVAPIINASRGVDRMLPGCYAKFLIVALGDELVNDKWMPYVSTSFVLHST